MSSKYILALISLISIIYGLSGTLLGQKLLANPLNESLLLNEINDDKLNKKRLCTDSPEIAKDIIYIGNKLGVTVVEGEPMLPGKDGTYEAFHGRLGKVTIRRRKFSSIAFCKLITHEFIHVLQHLNGNLKGVEPLGLKVPLNALGIYGSWQEAEAYLHQNRASYVLYSLEQALMKQKMQKL